MDKTGRNKVKMKPTKTEKIMTAEESLINAQHQIKQLEEDCKDLQQENVRLRQVLKIKENDFQNLAKALEEIRKQKKYEERI